MDRINTIHDVEPGSVIEYVGSKRTFKVKRYGLHAIIIEIFPSSDVRMRTIAKIMHVGNGELRFVRDVQLFARWRKCV